MVALINDCEAADHLYGGASVEALRAEIESLAVDLERDVRLWQDAASPTGATQFYSSARFSTAFTLAAYAREVT